MRAGEHELAGGELQDAQHRHPLKAGGHLKMQDVAAGSKQKAVKSELGTAFWPK